MLKLIHTKKLYFESVLESKVNQKGEHLKKYIFCVDIFC